MRENGVDLDEMERQRSEYYYDWLGAHCQDRTFLECCARVRFRCEFEDGTAAYLTGVKSATPEAREIEQLANLHASNFGAPGPGHKVLKGRAAKQTGKQAKTSAELSKQRSDAGKKKKQVQDPEDALKIKKRFMVYKEAQISDHTVAKLVSEMVADIENPLELKDSPYFLSVDTVKRIAGVKK